MTLVGLLGPCYDRATDARSLGGGMRRTATGTERHGRALGARLEIVVTVRGAQGGVQEHEAARGVRLRPAKIAETGKPRWEGPYMSVVRGSGPAARAGGRGPRASVGGALCVAFI